MADTASGRGLPIETVQVALRIRPLMQQEIDRGCDECIEVVHGTPQVQIKDIAFTYNYVFAQHITQQEFYDTAVKGLVDKLFNGYNVTILAYGQTGSGKTYTMGTNYSGSMGDATKLGVIPQCVADIFEYVETHEETHAFRVKVSFMELYQEQCFDLLSGKERNHSIIEIREDVNKGVILPGLTELPVTSTSDTMMVLERGSAGRVTGSTAMNQTSSRSHAVFTIIIDMENRTDKNMATTSKFHLVDLAGSERIKKTKASGERLKEGVKINQGLLALGNVISALGDGTNRSFISYRDSKLTRLLQDSLGGNSVTLMVACVSPADYNLDETVSTLRYADRARRIRNKPIINQDAKSAEIVRLNNLVNQLRLELLGKAPPSIGQNNSELAEELESERAKYAELMKKYKQLSENMSKMLIEYTSQCEKALLAEAAKDQIERKLNELTEQCNQTIENLNTTDDANQKSTVVDYLKEMKSRLADLQTVNMQTEDDINNHEILRTFVVSNGEGKEEGGAPLDMSEDMAAEEEGKRAMEQMLLNKELNDLNRNIAIKACLVKSILASNKNLIIEDQNLRETEDKVALLEKERDELLQQLKNTKSRDPTHEARRSKVSALEQEIATLKKTCQDQASVIRAKQKNEQRMAALNAELQAMKSTKVRIIRQMREEGEKYRKWKAESEKALLRLRTEDRKRQAAMAKMSSLHAKQTSVLKRKMEAAVCVNKRLKEALDRQKQCQVKRNAKGNLKVGAVQQYVEQELEMHLSVFEAERSLEELMEYRALITEEIETLRRSPESEAKTKKMSELEDDLALRKAQISDLQQKIMSADQENKARTQWDNIQSMLEAKVALKCLFDLLVDAKRELTNTCDKGYQAKYEEMKETYDRLLAEFESSKEQYEQQLDSAKLQSDQKLATLLAIQPGVVTSEERGEACRHLQNVIQYQQERLDQLDDENKRLAVELEELRAVNKKGGRKNKPKGALEAVKRMEYIEPTDEEDNDDDHPDKDPDWVATTITTKRPQAPPAQRSRLTMNFTSAKSEPAAPAQGVKRGSDGSAHCACRGSCGTKLCGCVKADLGCGAGCRCLKELCKNRRLSSDDSDDKENRGGGQVQMWDADLTAFVNGSQSALDSIFADGDPSELNIKKKKVIFPKANSEKA